MNERIIFAGTPDFAAQHLQALLDAGTNIVAVYTQPDRPAGRGHKLTPSPVKALALAHNLPVYTPLNFKHAEDVATFQSHQADLCVVVAYGLILPESILQAPRLGCINVHGSLLPQWRGAAPIQRALLSGDKTTGVTIIQLVKALDAGDMLYKSELIINEDDTSETLFNRLSQQGAATLVEALPLILQGKVTPEAQDPSLVTYAEKLSKEESPLNFTKDAASLALQVRGLNPWPVATCVLNEVTYKVFAAKAYADAASAGLSDLEAGAADANTAAGAADANAAAGAASAGGNAPGTILGITREGIAVACSAGVLVLTTVQAPGKGRVAAADLARSKKDVFARGQSFA